MTATDSAPSLRYPIIKYVDWMAAFRQLLRPNEARCANPHLLGLLRLATDLPVTEVFRLAESLCEKHGRDTVVKRIVGAFHGLGDEEYLRLLQRMDVFFDEEAGTIIGEGVLQVLDQAYAELQRQTSDLAAEPDPSADLTVLTGERLDFRVEIHPTLFLPPPQTGRHGTSFEMGQATHIHLYFGYPLREDPSRYGIDRAWLIGGAWHYAINRYLRDSWPQMGNRLAAMPELEATATTLLRPLRETVRWPDIIAEHLNIVFKCRLSFLTGVPDTVHRAFVYTRGLALFDWLQDWFDRYDPRQGTLRDYLQRLPNDLSLEKSAWEGRMANCPRLPPAINLALLARQRRKWALVVPEIWPESICSAVRKGWELLNFPLFRYEEWLRAGETAGMPLIALGCPGENPLADGILRERRLDWPESVRHAREPLLIALAQTSREEEAWRIAIVVGSPGVAARFPAETALQLTHTYAVFDGSAKLEGDTIRWGQGAGSPARG